MKGSCVGLSSVGPQNKLKFLGSGQVDGSFVFLLGLLLLGCGLLHDFKLSGTRIATIVMMSAAIVQKKKLY